LSRSDAEKLIKEISEKILTNPIIEKFEYTLE
jgi:phosphoribosylformylglycinamidine (FGAM) synthase PurS component